jgi:hypothetical protein
MNTSPPKRQLIPHFYSASNGQKSVRGFAADLNKLLSRSAAIFSLHINDVAAQKADLLFRMREITTQGLRYTLR